VVAHPVSPVHKPGILFPTYVDSSGQVRTSPDQDVIELHRDLVGVHPQPGLPERALAGFDDRGGLGDRAGARGPSGRTGLWRDSGPCRPRGFVPQLWRWLRDGEWRVPLSSAEPGDRIGCDAVEEHAGEA
jgi:hypothetical protein